MSTNRYINNIAEHVAEYPNFQLKEYVDWDSNGITKTDTFDIPAPTEDERHRQQLSYGRIIDRTNLVATIDGTPATIIPFGTVPPQGSIALDLIKGVAEFNSNDEELECSITYTGTGSGLLAFDINRVQKEIKEHEIRLKDHALTINGGNVRLENGTAAAPSLAFKQLSNTGLYRSINGLGISANGSDKVEIRDSNIAQEFDVKGSFRFTGRAGDNTWNPVACSVNGGNGGNQTSAAARAGGSVTIKGGQGGYSTNFDTDGAGGNVVIAGGDTQFASGNNANGGTVTIRSGYGSNQDGNINIIANNLINAGGNVNIEGVNVNIQGNTNCQGVNATGNIVSNGYVSGKQRIIDVDGTNRTLLAAESGATIYFSGSSDVLTLPLAITGLHFRIITKPTNDYIEIHTGNTTTQKIRKGASGATFTDMNGIISTQSGNQIIELTCFDGSNWHVTYLQGDFQNQI